MGLSGGQGGGTREPSSKLKHLEAPLRTNQAMKLSRDTLLPEYPEESEHQADHNAQDDGGGDGEIEAEAVPCYPDVTRELTEP